MHFSTTCALLVAPLAVVAAPNPARTFGSDLASKVLAARQDPAPTEEETEELFNAFAKAFITDNNITEAFTYIAEDYINHNPLAQNGFMSAWNILSGIWGGISKTLIGTAYDADMSWVNYQASGLGTIVDRFRWEGGCIAEHVRIQSTPAQPFVVYAFSETGNRRMTN
ncbi:unnamed protein product [Parascedosporium putredinis]|uniref:Uncharacterized protein n=1 Tax=Parascedosporium putredinis TaxID=1442378 RepID=A0A9P1M9T8_9PEZI|nr:unnamed protein product [Parascedosporium putredinis]CAI7992653.1 unnamed protein product [Parascedosporium putredinis]